MSAARRGIGWRIGMTLLIALLAVVVFAFAGRCG